MTTSAEIIRRRYTKHLIEFAHSGSLIGRDVALFALHVALDDLEEVWQDEYSCLERRVALATETATESGRDVARMHLTIEALRAGLQQVMIENDALEAECLRLRTTNESLSATSAATVSPAPAASSTSKPTAPIPPSPAAFSSENGGGGERVLSAPTSRRRKSRVTSHESRITEEVGDTTTPNPIDWPTALAGLLTPEQITYLEIGTTRWYKLDPETQSLLVMRIAATIYQHLGTVSQSIYQDYKPAWATSVGSWVATCPLTWLQVLDNLGVKPSTQLKSKRIKPGAMS